MANKTNLGKVVGDSAFQDWLKRNPGKTWEDFMAAIKGPQGEVLYGMSIKEVAFHGKTPHGDNVYNVILDDGSIAGKIIAPKGDPGDQGIPGLNWDGTRPEYPDIPTNIPYGTVFELAPGALPIAGWVFANGDTLPKGKYPHLVGVPGFESRQAPEKSDVNIDEVDWDNIFTENDIEYYKATSKDKKTILLKEKRGSSDSYDGRELRNNYYDSIVGSVYGQMITLNRGTTTEHKDFIEVRFDDSYYLHRVSFNNKTDKRNSDRFYIQVKSGDLWTTAAELNPSTDFLPDLDRGAKGTYNYIDLKKYKLLTNHFRIVGYNLTSNKQFFCGFRLYAGVQELQYKEVVTLPLVKTGDGRFKIVYIGQPIGEITESTMFSYTKDGTLNGEIPFSLAVENKLPSYSKGITMAEPKAFRMGYTNKYNSRLDMWELIKTHLDKEGYYYLEDGDLKYIPKPTICHIWDFKTNTWIENLELKEKAKKKLLDKYIELEIKKDKMLDLKLNTAFIVEEIEKTKKDLEELNG